MRGWRPPARRGRRRPSSCASTWPTAGVTSLCPLAQEWLRGGAGRNLILLDADGSYFAYDPATGARTLIVRAEDASLTTALFGTTLVCQEDGCFCLYDLLTGERTALGGYTVPGVEAGVLDRHRR